MSDAEIARIVARWLRYARDDLSVAELTPEHGQVPRAACFNAQQCAEKAIKGSLIFLQTGYPKTHNIQLEDPARFSGLSDWAVEPRYPGNLPEATDEDAKAAVEEAREIYETTFADLGRNGYAPPDGV